MTGCFILTSCSDNDDSDAYADEEGTDDNSIAYDDESKFLYDCEWHVTDSKYRTALEDIVTKISPVLGISRNGFWYTFEQYGYPLQVREAKMSLLPPCRVPFGTLSIKNDFNDGRIISDIKLVNEKGKICFTSYGNFDYEKQCVASVPVGTYEISFETRDRQGTKKNYTLSDGTFEVRRRNQQNDVATLNASTSFKEVPN